MSLKLPDYTFENGELLETALTHRSAGSNNYERLEFLGDSVLGFVITEDLFQRFPEQDEGTLTRLRANLVRKESLASLARTLELGDHIRLGPGERKSGGWRRDSILANTMESIIGAVYLDAGIDTCRLFILNLYHPMLEALDADNVGKDPKTVLQELLQSRSIALPLYTVIDEQGEAHKRIFTVSCEVDCLESTVIAQGLSKRTAEQAAADKVLKLLEIK